MQEVSGLKWKEMISTYPITHTHTHTHTHSLSLSLFLLEAPLKNS